MELPDYPETDEELEHAGKTGRKAHETWTSQACPRSGGNGRSGGNPPHAGHPPLCARR